MHRKLETTIDGKKKLKIGIVCYPTVGGSGVIATELGKMLAEKGHDIHFISSSVPFRLRKIYHNIFYHQVEINQYSVFQYPPYDIQLASKIAEVAAREQLDILHAHYAIPHAVCAILGKQMSNESFKIVTTLHGTDITVLGQDPSLKESIKFGIEKSNYVTAVSNALADQTYTLITPNKKIDTIYNFVDERTYQKVDTSYLREEFGIDENEKVIIHVSNFRAVKRVQDVVKAFNHIQKGVPAKLLLVGDGPEMPRVNELVREYNLEEKVLFLGKQENLEELYSISDLMLLLSEKESFGLVALEAMSCGVPSVVTNVGGLPEVIRNGENGYICELGNIEQIANRSLQILKDHRLQKQFSENGIERVQRDFASDKIVEKYESVYYRLIEMDGEI